MSSDPETEPRRVEAQQYDAEPQPMPEQVPAHAADAEWWRGGQEHSEVQ
jgi:hypothetical protein